MKKEEDLFPAIFVRNEFLSKTNQELRRENSLAISFMAECITKIIFPALAQLTKDKPSETQKANLEIVATSLQTVLKGLQPNKKGLLAQLKPLELLVVLLVGEGLSTDEIHKKTGLSIRTVENYRDRSRKKLGIKRTPRHKGERLKIFLKETH